MVSMNGRSSDSEDRSGKSSSWGAFIDSVADAGAECKDFGLCLEYFGFTEHESFVGVKVFIEVVEVVVLDKTYKKGIIYDVDSYSMIR